jgi:activator of 2-hydroxyglutaryl-CoA dehydratase
MNIVYELDGKFNIRYASSEEFNNTINSYPAYQSAEQDVVDLTGHYIGIDIGGSDIKAALLKNGKTSYSYKEDWSPKTFTSASQHKEFILKLISKNPISRFQISRL